MTLIGHRCKSGNIFSRVLLIGRRLFQIKMNEATETESAHVSVTSRFRERRFSNSAVVAETIVEATKRSLIAQAR